MYMLNVFEVHYLLRCGTNYINIRDYECLSNVSYFIHRTNDKLFCFVRALRVRKKMTTPGDDIAIIGDILCENVSIP